MAVGEPVSSDLVLVGGGHAHVQVLRRFMMAPLSGVRLTVVLDRAVAVYSGMVPGLVAGDYAPEAIEIDVVPLARRARARVVLAAALAVDPVARRIELDGRPPIPYDVASLDVGSTVRGLDLPGVREHALATRPIGRFVTALPLRLAAAQVAGLPLRLVVVGGGVAGVELAFTLDARLRERGTPVEISLLCDTLAPLPGTPKRVSRRLAEALAARGISLRTGVRVSGVDKDAVSIGDERLPCDLAVWATGAAPPAVVTASPLPRDEAGFVRVRPTLQVEGHDELFAVGDCAALSGYPWMRKAGVYAVREGPVLEANLRALVTGRALRRYRPQRDFLALVNLGQRRAIGTKWGMAAQGRAVWRAKDWIDRRFMRRFQVLDDLGQPAADFPTPESMGMEEMECGGCAAKVGASPLERALRRLPAAAADTSVLLGVGDDAAAFELPRGDVLLATIDGFRAFTDDPWLVGRVAAVNAVSDVLAKGGAPRHALALVTVPEQDPDRAEESLFQVLAGVRAALDPLEISLVGGHSTTGSELFVGLTVTGTLAPGEDWLALDGARPGDRLILTKPLGTGIVLAADMQGRATGAWLRATHASMLRSNAHAARVAREAGAHACTDISGFGLAGHLAELLRASGVCAAVELAGLPALPGALALVRRGIRSSFHAQNESFRRVLSSEGGMRDAAETALLFDPQTSGGLLFAVSEADEAGALRALREASDPEARAIGVVKRARPDGRLLEISE